MIARRRFFSKLFAVVTTALVPAAAWAESPNRRRKHAANATPPPSPVPPVPVAESSEKKAGGAQLRLWKTNDTPDQPIQVRLLRLDKPDSEALSPLAIEANSYQFTNYVEVPGERLTAEVSSPDRPTVVLPLILADGSQSTLLIRRLGSGLSAEWIDDSPGPTDGGCEFDVYNLLPASGDIQVTIGDFLTVRLSSARSTLRLRGIKRGTYPIVTNGTDSNGKNFRWSTDADFRQNRKATLLIFPDLYGRIRPRVNTV